MTDERRPQPRLFGARTAALAIVLGGAFLVVRATGDGDPAWVAEARAGIAEASGRLTTNAGDTEARVQRAELYTRLDAFDEAMRDWDLLTEAEPDRASHHRGRAHTLFRAARDDAAFLAVRRALELAPDDAANHALHGRMLLVQGLTEAALAAGERALALDPDGEGHEITGRALVVLGRYEHALRALDRAVLVSPESELVHEARGQALLVLRRFGEAEQAFLRALEIDGEFTAAQNGYDLARAGVVGGQIVQAVLEGLKEMK